MDSAGSTSSCCLQAGRAQEDLTGSRCPADACSKSSTLGTVSHRGCPKYTGFGTVSRLPAISCPGSNHASNSSWSPPARRKRLRSAPTSVAAQCGGWRDDATPSFFPRQAGSGQDKGGDLGAIGGQQETPVNRRNSLACQGAPSTDERRWQELEDVLRPREHRLLLPGGLGVTR